MTGQADEGRFTIDDCLRAGYCPSGVRRWLHDHDYPVKSFLREGMPMDVARGFGDAFIERALKIKEQRDGR